LQAALKTAKRKISIRHLSRMEARKNEALKTMGAASKYYKDLEDFAAMLAGKKVNMKKVLDRLYPISKQMTKRQIATNDEVKASIQTIFKQKNDLQNFRGTAWGAYQAIADYRSNAEPRRKTATYGDAKMARFLDGDEVMNTAQSIILEMAA
jgi:MoxR-like ATPase